MTRRQVEMIAMVNPAVHELWTMHVGGELSWEQFLIEAVIALHRQSQQFERLAIDAVSRGTRLPDYRR